MWASNYFEKHFPCDWWTRDFQLLWFLALLVQKRHWSCHAWPGVEVMPHVQLLLLGLKGKEAGRGRGGGMVLNRCLQKGKSWKSLHLYLSSFCRHFSPLFWKWYLAIWERLLKATPAVGEVWNGRAGCCGCCVCVLMSMHTRACTKVKQC